MKKTKVLFAIWGILVVIIVGLLTALGFILDDRYETYKVLEDKLEASAKDYVQDNNAFLDEEEIVVDAQELIMLEYLDELVVNNDSCEGYVVINRSNSTYDAYITCGKYTTSGYKK